MQIEYANPYAASPPTTPAQPGTRRSAPLPEAADALGIGRSKVYELLRAGTLPSIRIDSVGVSRSRT